MGQPWARGETMSNKTCRNRKTRSVLAGPEDQPELADPDLVAVDQGGGPVTRPAVEVGAVERAGVPDGDVDPGPLELGVLPGDRGVVQGEVAVPVPADRGHPRRHGEH